MGIVKFLLCIAFITNTVSYSACPAINFPLFNAMRDKYGGCVAYSFSALEECLEDMVDDLNKTIDYLFGDTLDIVRKGFIIKDSVNNSMLRSNETGFAIFGDDHAFVQLFVHNRWSLHYNDGRFFCVDIFGAHEYVCDFSDDPKEYICTKWGRYKSSAKMDFPPKWGKRERIIQCHPCQIFQFGQEFYTWKSPYPAIEIETKIRKQRGQND